MARYFAAESQGLYFHWRGEPGLVKRFASQAERDEWVSERREIRRPVNASHLWVKQACWRASLDNVTEWSEFAVLLVSYDMTLKSA